MNRNRMYLLAGMIIAILALASLAGCSQTETKAETTPSEKEKPMVAVSIVPQQTFVKAVCGDLADVVVMIPPGGSPANYEPTPQEMENFSKSKVYFTVGVPTEAANILPKAKEISGLKIVNLQDEVSLVYDEREISPGQRDPHIWLSPKRAMVMVDSIAREMIALDPENKKTYEANAAAYVEELKELDGTLHEAFDNMDNKKFIVYHPAFGYLADDYGLTMYALEQEGKEATPQRLTEMIDLAKAEDIKAIFYQAEIASKQAESFAEEIGGQTVMLAPLSPDYINNLKQIASTMIEVIK